jgi:Family of unknown function (DUF6459)
MGPGRHPRLPARQEAGPCCPTPPPPSPPSSTPTRSANATPSAPPPAHSSAPGQAGARIALAICEVEAGLRSPLQLEQRCHLTLWPKLSARLRRSGGPAVPVGSLIRVVAQEHVPELAEVTVLVRRGGRVVPVAMRLDGAKGRWELVEVQY